MLKTQLKFIVTIALVLGLSISFQSLVASWQAPSANPPNPNIDKPINISSDFQEKTGSFSVGGTLGVGIGLNSLGQIAIKNNSPQIKFDDDSGDGYWIHNNSGRLYFLWDESDDGDWDGPHPLYLQGRDAVFGGRARTTRTVLNGDPGDTIATKKYVDDNGGGGGSLRVAVSPTLSGSNRTWVFTAPVSGEALVQAKGNIGGGWAGTHVFRLYNGASQIDLSRTVVVRKHAGGRSFSHMAKVNLVAGQTYTFRLTKSIASDPFRDTKISIVY